MFPFFRPGDRLVVRSSADHPLKTGDVVVFATADVLRPAWVAHRIVGVNAAGAYITKGDNLPLVDADAKPGSAIAGQVVLVLRQGRALSLTSAPYRRLGPWLAILSRHNLTPGLIASRFKMALRQRR
jgi:signal peptidase I